MTGKEMMAREEQLLADLIAERDSLRKQVKELTKQRKWVGLTDAGFYEVIRPFYGTDESCSAAIRISLDEFKAIEAKLMEKNA